MSTRYLVSKGPLVAVAAVVALTVREPRPVGGTGDAVVGR